MKKTCARSRRASPVSEPLRTATIDFDLVWAKEQSPPLLHSIYKEHCAHVCACACRVYDAVRAHRARAPCASIFHVVNKIFVVRKRGRFAARSMVYVDVFFSCCVAFHRRRCVVHAHRVLLAHTIPKYFVASLTVNHSAHHHRTQPPRTSRDTSPQGVCVRENISEKNGYYYFHFPCTIRYTSTSLASTYSHASLYTSAWLTQERSSIGASARAILPCALCVHRPPRRHFTRSPQCAASADSTHTHTWSSCGQHKSF